ncbi:MAG TPA: hypothetical protein VGM92_04705 [Candidatus Kapabacteria bacterium]|jgi:hypothetical protein
MKLLTAFLLLIPTLAMAQLPKPSESIAKVYSEFSSCTFIDTIYADDKDPEGHLIVESIYFAPVDNAGIRGFTQVTFDAAGLASKASWHRREVQIEGDGADFYLSYGDPNLPMLDSIKSDGTIAQLKTLLSTVPKSWGKADRENVTSRIGYYYRGKHIMHGVVLNEGALTVGWTLN